MEVKKREDLANTISHAFGFIIGIVILPFACKDLYFRNIPYMNFAVLLYGLSFIFLFLSSSVYHALDDIKLKKLFQKIDHISIYFMIAGSYTPFIFACLDGFIKWIFFGIMWGLAILGTVFKVFNTGRFEKLSLILYLGMGWMLIFIFRPFYLYFDMEIISLVAIGGLAYTAGVYFYVNDSRRYFHLIWHIFVLAGALFHLRAVVQIT